MNPSVPPPPTKQGICKSLSQGKPLPTKLCTSFAKLNSKIDAKDAKYNRLASHMDDEYGNAGWNHQHFEIEAICKGNEVADSEFDESIKGVIISMSL
ncbi:hypothetical protein ACHAW6_000160 [Cyclotella cf. meneghiniana]